MGRIAIIKNGIITDIIIGDENFANSISEDTVILDNEEVGIGYTFDGINFTPPAENLEEKKLAKKIWRNLQLAKTDFIVPLTDYPNHAAWITYRQELRDWPTTENFPNTKPTAPAEL